MNIRPSAAIRQNYNEIAEQCRKTAEFEKTANSLEIMPQRCPWLTGEYIPRNAYRFILLKNDI